MLEWTVVGEISVDLPLKYVELSLMRVSPLQVFLPLPHIYLASSSEWGTNGCYCISIKIIPLHPPWNWQSFNACDDNYLYPLHYLISLWLRTNSQWVPGSSIWENLPSLCNLFDWTGLAHFDRRYYWTWWSWWGPCGSTSHIGHFAWTPWKCAYKRTTCSQGYPSGESEG